MHQTSTTPQSPRIAIVHDQISEFGGAERVLVSLKRAFPHADVYTSFVDEARLGVQSALIKGWSIRQSFLRFVPFIGRLYSPLRFLLPLVWRSFDLSSYDIVICSSSWGMSKGVSLLNAKYPTSPKLRGAGKMQGSKLHEKRVQYVCYLHTPPRYLYGYDESALKRYWIVRVYALIVNHFLRQYDYLSSQTIDQFIFNSQEVRSRSLKFYRRDGVVLHPPIHTVARDRTSRVASMQDRPYYLTVSRLAPTKHIDVLIHACNTLALPLKIVGTGKEHERLREIAGPTIQFMGFVSDRELNDLYANARCFLYASLHEDFGMVPVEAMAHGVPVIAHASGGAKETVTDGVSGYLYPTLTPDAVLHKIQLLESLDDDAYASMCAHAREYAQTCSESSFMLGIRKIVQNKV